VQFYCVYLQVTFYNVPGSKDPHLERKLAVNTLKDLVICDDVHSPSIHILYDLSVSL